MRGIPPGLVKRGWHWLAIALAAAALLGAAAAWWWGRDDSLDRVRRAGVLRVGYAVEPPFATLSADGVPGGQSVACAREVARQLGVQVAWVKTSLDRQVPDLLAGRFDVIGAGLFVSAKRAEQVRFSLPTLRVRPAWITRAGEAAPTVARLQQGLRVAVVAGSAAEDIMAKLVPAQRLHRVPDLHTGVSGVREGSYDTLAVPWPAGRWETAGREAELAVHAADDGRPVRDVALAFRPADQRLARAADEALAPWLASAAYAQLLQQLRLGPDDLPAPQRTLPAR